MPETRRFRPFALPRWNRDVRLSRDICGRAQDRRVADETLIRTADRPAAGSRQFVEQRLGLFQIGGVEALGEPAVEGREQLARFGPPTLLAPSPPQASG